jgi:hypothetical protein
MDNWTVRNRPYYSVRHQAYTHPPSLLGAATFIGWSKSGAALYDVTVSFTGSVTYNTGLYNTIWEAETICTASGETADASIGPPGIR